MGIIKGLENFLLLSRTHRKFRIFQKIENVLSACHKNLESPQRFIYVISWQSYFCVIELVTHCKLCNGPACSRTDETYDILLNSADDKQFPFTLRALEVRNHIIN